MNLDENLPVDRNIIKTAYNLSFMNIRGNVEK